MLRNTTKTGFNQNREVMKKTLFVIAMISGGLLVSCNSRNNQNVSEVEEIDVLEPDVTYVESPIEDNGLVRSSVVDRDGNRMDLTYNNDLGTATIDLDGETIYMTQDTMASGVRMHNDEYVYEEWQGHIVLKKDGKVVFDNEDKVTTSVSDKEGKRLDLDFNNNNNTATLKLQNGETINLRADTTASGIRYSNQDYVYEEWQGHSVLKKNGKVIFDNKK